MKSLKGTASLTRTKNSGCDWFFANSRNKTNTIGQTSTFTEKDRWKTYKISYKEPKEVSMQMKWGAGGGGSHLLRYKIQCKVERLSKQDPQKSPTRQSPSPAPRGQTIPLTAKSSVIPVYPLQFAKKPHQVPASWTFWPYIPDRGLQREPQGRNYFPSLLPLWAGEEGSGWRRRRRARPLP